MDGFSAKQNFQQLLIRWVLVVVPTIAIGYVTLRFVNFSYTALNSGIVSQTIYFSFGLLLAYSLYYYGARWVVSLIVLWLAYLLAGRIISRLPGEFDVFYATARFQLYSTLFIIGWIFGLLLAKLRWAHFVLFGLLTVVTLISISDTIDVSLSYILLHIAPVMVYGLYMLFLSPVLTERIEISAKKSAKFLVRIALFVLLILLALFITESLFSGNLKAVEKELAARGAKGKDGKGGSNKDNYDDRNGLMEKTDDGYRLKDTMRVNSKMSSSDKLMFCARLDNYFPDGSPAPLYFVYHYLTRYDPAKESFTRDVNVPSLDELDVDPARLPMYYSFTDTSILRKAMADKFRKITEASVYLSENTWKHAVLSPSSAFHIQTIPVEKDFQKTFLSAYKTYSFTSELNNAYFVYNISASPMLEKIQAQRNEELGKIKNYNRVSSQFVSYYTAYPTGAIYDSISKLAFSLSSKEARPIDKVLAVRDFFLKRNENGKRIFKYSLRAGAIDDPNIPSSKMLYNFLFKTHTGYCTYYAGASLFMLRALGVPTRFTTGFATINRSDKNKGWYWFYASQAHAWTQVYFPEYGWMDFDMTIGNEEQQGAPKPDGTPPLPPPEPWLVLSAKAETIDLKKKQLTASFKNLIFQNTPYELNKIFTRPVDASLCRVLYNKRDTTLAAISPGDSLIIVSYKDEAKQIPQPQAGVAIESQVEKFPSPIIADEIHIRGKEKQAAKKDTAKKKNNQPEKKITLKDIAWVSGFTLGSALLLLLLFPLLYLTYRTIRLALASKGTAKADQLYRATLYRLHMAGMERETETPLEYAEKKIDPSLAINFAGFMKMYLRLKYAQRNLSEEDNRQINQLAKEIGPALRKKNGFIKSFINYFKVGRAIRYFQSPTETENPTV
ncbi:MAG: transglutaminase domain-containing protein [Bacteroidetes bacterium]|nr:transglutaminase domain-containing protein [Bacteroidota bacterium]MBS1540095.1 transglutaminase domain-containing protein [Bacteroidota bacterium]